MAYLVKKKIQKQKKIMITQHYRHIPGIYAYFKFVNQTIMVADEPMLVGQSSSALVPPLHSP